MSGNFASEDNPLLKAAILQRIHQQGRLSFANFMEMALYYPGEGYYTNRPALIGARGDFYTAPHVSAAFGELIARQIIEMWERLGSPATFTIVEMGAGQGLIAGDVLTFIKNSAPKMWPAVQYQILEISEALIHGQAKRLSMIPDGAEFLERVEWVGWDDLLPNSVTGCFLSNELVDAFPVHLVTVAEGELREIFITAAADGQLQEEVAPLSSAKLSNYFNWLGINITNTAYTPGYRTEVNLQALEWIEKVAGVLARGYILTLDYGYEAASRYHPRRSAGTLQCYYQHQLLANPYINLGRMDITAHVDFTALQKAGTAAGLSTLGFTSQSIFLSTLGLGEMLAKLSAAPTPQNPNELLSQRRALMNLINPQGLGNNKVLLQAKNVPLEPPLTGFSL